MLALHNQSHGRAATRLLIVLVLLLAGGASRAGSEERPASWWAAFADPVLDNVMQAAAPVTPAAQQQVVESYIVARLGQVRVLLAQALLQSAGHQQAVLMNAPVDQQRQAMLAALARRLESMEATAEAIAAGRDEGLAALSQASGLAPGQLSALLAPVRDKAVMPAVKAQPPSAAGVSVLRADVAQRLQLLAEQDKQVQRSGQIVATRQMELQAHQTREELGAEDEFGTLEAYQQFVVESDELAKATGRLALAWALWLQGGGSHTVATAQ